MASNSLHVLKVIVYTTPTCPYCKQVKALLRRYGIPFEEKDVARNRENAMEMYIKSGQLGTPVTDIDGKIIIGYDPEAILEALGIEE